jgi:hypothetical protein
MFLKLINVKLVDLINVVDIFKPMEYFQCSLIMYYFFIVE